MHYPRIMGHELAVEVLQAIPELGFVAGELCAVNPYLSCGSCVACAAGKPNCCVKISVLGVHQDGGMAEFLCVPPANLLKADGLSADACAAVEFLAIGAHAVRRGDAGRGDKSLVVGAGPIGLGTALFAKLSGAEVAIYDRDAARAKAIAALLGVVAIPPTPGDDNAVAAFSGTDQFDIVFDATGNAASMEIGFDHVCAGGRYVLVSVVKDTISFKDPDFHRKEMTLLASRNATSEDFARVIAAIRSGGVPIDRIVTHRTALAAAVTKLPFWSREKDGLIKALIEID
jgi:2-desacetyl-2-hydroxyethyl bacteriochlorophyllide A dehydrogenase